MEARDKEKNDQAGRDTANRHYLDEEHSGNTDYMSRKEPTETTHHLFL